MRIHSLLRRSRRFEQCASSQFAEQFFQRRHFAAGHGFQFGQPFQCHARLFVKSFVVFKLPVAAGGEVVFVGIHLILAHPELPRELVDFRLQRRDARLQFGQFRLGFFPRSAGFVRLAVSGDDFLKF